jgi:hypothetical protein
MRIHNSMASALAPSVWYPGFLEGWRRYDDGWMASVTYRVAVGMHHVDWVGAERVRPF